MYVFVADINKREFGEAKRAAFQFVRGYQSG
jgi:hypothetical protein